MVDDVTTKAVGSEIMTIVVVQMELRMQSNLGEYKMMSKRGHVNYEGS